MKICDDPSCDHGRRPTTPAYTEALFPITDEMTEEQQATQLWKRRLYPVFWFPCPVCRPSQFLRWQNGCFRPNHRAGQCELCQEAMGERKAQRADRGAA